MLFHASLPYPLHTPGLTKENKPSHCLRAPSLSRRPYSLSRRPYSVPAFLPPSSWHSHRLRHPKTLVHSCARNAFHKPICPNPKRISEATNKRVPGGYLNNKRRYRGSLLSSMIWLLTAHTKCPASIQSRQYCTITGLSYHSPHVRSCWKS